MSGITTSEDYVDTPVPAAARQSFLSVLFIWIGFIIVVGTMSVGSGLAVSAPIGDVMRGIMIGNVVLGLFAVLAGYIGAASGKSFYQLAEDAFGPTSARLVGIYPPIILIGWFAVESAILGGFIGGIAGLSDTMTRALMVVAAIVMAVSATLGYRALKNLSYGLIPVIFILGFYALAQVDFGSLAAKQKLVGPVKGLGEIAGIVISTWIMGVVVCLPDVARFARTPWHGAMAGFIGILIGNIFNLLIGTVASIQTGQHDPAQILVSIGFISLAVILAVANIWTTNDNNLYSASLNVARVVNITRIQAAIICAAIGAFFSWFNPATMGWIFTILLFMGSTAPALGGVIFGGYLVRRSRSLNNHAPVGAWLGWGLGSAASYGIGGLYGILLGFVIGAVCVSTAYMSDKTKSQLA